jgi:hypothetical protein
MGRPCCVRRTMNRSPFLLVLALLALVVAAACTPAGSGSDGPASADDAVRLALGLNDRFAGIERRDPNVIGQAAWYEVAESNAGWQVQIYMGWGDCPAGCISHHTWVYEVGRAGAVELLSQEGDALANGTSIR